MTHENLEAKIVMVILDTGDENENSVRILCPEAMARAIAAQPGAEIDQDNAEYLVVLTGKAAGVICDIHL